MHEVIQALYEEDQAEMIKAKDQLAGMGDVFISHFREVESRIARANVILRENASTLGAEDFYKLGVIFVHGEHSLEHLAMSLYCFDHAHKMGHKKGKGMYASAKGRMDTILGTPAALNDSI